MANMEIQGKIIKIGPIQTVGQNGSMLMVAVSGTAVVI